jgi:hypothetical protein
MRHRESGADGVVGIEPRAASPLARAGRLEGTIEDRPGPVRGWGHEDPEGQRQAHSRPHMIRTPCASYEAVRDDALPPTKPSR